MAYASEIVKAGGISPGSAAGIGGQYQAVTATGSVIGDAAGLTASMCVVAGGDGTKGVALQGQVGDEVWVFNNSGSTLKVWPHSSSAAIDVTGTGLGTVAAAHSLLTYKVGLYKQVTSTHWLVVVT